MLSLEFLLHGGRTSRVLDVHPCLHYSKFSELRGEIAENTAMKTLLKQLHRETFVLDTKEPLPDTISIAGFETHKTDEQMLEVALEKGGSLNAVFAALSEQGVEVTSMRNKANRLEELFVSLLAKS